MTDNEKAEAVVRGLTRPEIKAYWYDELADFTTMHWDYLKETREELEQAKAVVEGLAEPPAIDYGTSFAFSWDDIAWEMKTTHLPIVPGDRAEKYERSSSSRPDRTLRLASIRLCRRRACRL